MTGSDVHHECKHEQGQAGQYAIRFGKDDPEPGKDPGNPDIGNEFGVVPRTNDDGDIGGETNNYGTNGADQRSETQ